jgi:predicted dehydrogenase
VARHLSAARASVVCFLGTSEASVGEAERELAQALEPVPAGYLDLEAMLAEQRLDALAILSPHETHERYLEAALAAGLHCLCEKPLVWDGPRPAASARRIVDRFQQQGLQLWENCQLPYLLEAYEQLHPGSLGRRPSRFEMQLSPVSIGEAMLVDALHHPLSLLQALAPADKPRVEGARFLSQNRAKRLRVHFTWRNGSPGLEVEVQLQQQLEPPREAALAVDGVWARREIREPGYRIFLRAGERAVPVVDPLARLVSDFVGTLRGEATPSLQASSPQAIVQRTELLAELVAAYRAGKD